MSQWARAETKSLSSLATGAVGTSNSHSHHNSQCPQPVTGGASGHVDRHARRAGASDGTDGPQSLDPRAECKARKRSTAKTPSRSGGKERPHGQRQSAGALRRAALVATNRTRSIVGQAARWARIKRLHRWISPDAIHGPAQRPRTRRASERLVLARLTASSEVALT